MTTNPQILDGVWRIYTATDTPEVHPSLLGALRRGGWVQMSGPIRLTEKGRQLVQSLEAAHTKCGMPLPAGRTGGDV